MYTPEQKEALRDAFLRTIPYESLERTWGFQRQRQIMESGVDPGLPMGGDAPSSSDTRSGDAGAEVERLLAELRGELEN